MLEEGTLGERTLTTQDEPTPGMRMGQDREDRLPLTCCHLPCHLVPRVESAQLDTTPLTPRQQPSAQVDCQFLCYKKLSGNQEVE